MRCKHLNFYVFPILCLIISITAKAFNDSSQTFLLKPTGNYDIGTKELFLTDSTRIETLSKSKTFRRIYVKIWYPTKNRTDNKYDKYLTSYPKEIISDIFASHGLNNQLIDSIVKFNTFSVSELPINGNTEMFPLILFNPGFYFGMVDFYTSFMENLASHGYIVCSINHPYEQPFIEFPNGEKTFLKKKKAQLGYLQLFLANKFQFRKRNTPKKVEIITRNYLHKLSILDKVVRRWTIDTQFFLNYIKNKHSISKQIDVYSQMDLNNIGILGQSLGGAVAGEICLNDSTIKAGVNMDCFQFGKIIDNPLKVPFMLIQSEHYIDWNIGNSVIYRNSESNFFKLTIYKSKHFVFSDAALIPLVKTEDKIKLIGNVDGVQSINTINKYILCFFNQYLKNIKSDLLEKETNNSIIKFEKLK